MWLLRKKHNELNDEEKEILSLLFNYSPLLKKAYDFQKQWIKAVEKSKLTCFNTFIKTLNKLWSEILNYFINRLNSGFVEGLNNKIKVLKRRCYGIFDTDTPKTKEPHFLAKLERKTAMIAGIAFMT